MKENKEKNIVITKKRKRKSDVMRWSDLPNDLLVAIKRRLFFTDQQNLHTVCKSWSSIQEKEEKILALPLPQMPWLLVLGERNSCKLVDPKYKKTYMVDMKTIKKKMNIRSYDKMQCHESKYGWLLISSDNQKLNTTELLLYSPFLGDNNNCIELPILSFRICLATFTSNPLDEDCKVITLSNSVNNAIRINTYHRGNCAWTSQVCKCDEQFSVSNVKLWMYTDEDIFYYVIRDGRVGTFDIAREEWKVFPPLPTTIQSRLPKLLRDDDVYMVKSGEGELFLISEYNLSHNDPGSWRWHSHYIYKLNLSSMIWEELNSIGERVLFIGNGYNSILNSSVLKSNRQRKGVLFDMICCCSSYWELNYCTVRDYTIRYSDNGFPRRQHCSRHYGPIARKQCRKLLIDPPPLPHYNRFNDKLITYS